MDTYTWLESDEWQVFLICSLTTLTRQLTLKGSYADVVQLFTTLQHIPSVFASARTRVGITRSFSNSNSLLCFASAGRSRLGH